MKKLIYFLLVIILALATFILYPKKPELLKVKVLKVENLLQPEISLKTEFKFSNPNLISLNLVAHNIDVFLEGKLVGNFTQNESREIPAKENFSIPVNIKINRSKVLGDNGLLKSLWRSTVEQEIIVQYKGTVDVKILGLAIPIPIDYSKNILESED